MPMIGKTLGHYEITSQLGKGGMGEVFQAKDQVLGRDVAIKVLPEEFAKDADRVARFQREAKLLASLNHPNIAAIHGLEESAGTNFLVLELVEGETLADRIKAGPIPVEESLKLALQIAQALEAAHEKGVIHRDLKPANIKVTPDGKVKVLDFGLAKAYAVEQEQPSLSASPTLSQLATQQGIILGTAAYMAPEQARGKNVDRRADIWAFGSLVYEMLTGRTAFQGEDVTEILATIVKGGANLDLLPANIHPRVREVITRCLQKEPKRRYRDITEAQYEIEQVLADPSGVFVQQVTAGKPRKRARVGLHWVAAALVLGAILAGVAIWRLKPAEPRQVVRFGYELPEDLQFSTLFSNILAVSPNGKQFVYCTSKGIYLHSVDEFSARLIAGTEGSATWPFFSPNGQWIGYFSEADGKLKKIAINGGASVSLCDVASGAGASWNADDVIVYSAWPNTGTIMRVSANGGNPEPLVKEEESGAFISPQILPDRTSVLFTHLKVGDSAGKVFVHSLKSGERKELFPGEIARYLPTGHIIYAVGPNLFAVPFDMERLNVASGQVPVVEGVFTAAPPLYAVSDTGTLVYLPGTADTVSAPNTFVWVDRNGKEELLTLPANVYSNPRISPDGKRVALVVGPSSSSDVWIWDFALKSLSRLTRDKGEDCNPVWSPDGKRIAFHTHQKDSRGGIYWKAADGTGDDVAVGSFPGTEIFPSSWSGDGKTLLVRAGFPGMAIDIAAQSVEGDKKYKLLLKDPFGEFQPRISRDGQWMAYTSDESGKTEVYVRPFPELNKERWKLSANGGESPLWSPNGRELFYRNGDTVMVVSVKTEPVFSHEAAKLLFKGYYVSSSPNDAWDIDYNGKRFLMIKEPQSAASTNSGPRKIHVVLNWTEELKKKVPVK